MGQYNARRERQPNRTVAYIDSSASPSNDESFNSANWSGFGRVPLTTNKLNPTRVKIIRSLYHSGEYNQAELAEMFDVTAATINHIVLRKTWAWVI
jgi:hypothetical protein